MAKSQKELEVNIKDSSINKADLKGAEKDSKSQPRKGRGRSRKGTSDGHNPKTSGSNDVAWYASSPELLKSAASIPFSTTTGMKTPYAVKHFPGVYAMYWEPSLLNLEAMSAAANSAYSFQVHANSRNTKYNAMDLMFVNIAGMNFFSFLALGIRTYGMMKMYNQENRYLPKALVQASGFDFEDLSTNYFKMWFTLNEVISKSSQLWIPSTMPLLQRWWWMNSNVYIDSETVKGQYYIFAPRRVLKYNETGAETGATLDAVEWLFSSPDASFDPAAIKYHTWDEYMSLLNQMLDNLISSEDRGIMFGDALKAYGEDRIYAVSPIDSNYMVTPVYDREVLSQIENATSTSQTVDKYTVTGPSTLSYTLAVRADDWHKWLPSEVVLNFHQKEDPTPDQIMVATRLTAAGFDHDRNEIVAVGTEHIVTMFMTIIADDDKTLYRTPVSTIESLFYAPSQPQKNWNRFTIFERSMFDWAPMVYSWYDNNSNPTLDTLTNGGIIPVGDIDNYAILSQTNLQYMHNTAIYSLLGVPVL